MIASFLKYAALTLFVIVTAGGSCLLHRQNTQIRARLPDVSRQRQQLADIRAENVRLRAIIAQATHDHASAARSVAAEVALLRAEVGDLERQAVTRRAEMLAAVARDIEAMATNRDPSKGLVRMENFANVGQATPAAALQTLIWASLHADEATLAKVLALSEPGRSEAESLIGRLPPDAQARWTPDKLAALFVTDTVTNMNALQILREQVEDSEHTTLTLRFPGGGVPRPLEFQLTQAGWQARLPDQAIDVLQKKLNLPN